MTSFADHLTASSTSFDDQPQHPTDGKPCAWDDDGVSIGWVWNGHDWVAACNRHMSINPIPSCQLFNTSYRDD